MARFDTLCLSLTIASLSILGVWSQSPPSPPPCVRACSDSSAQSASCSSTDVNCICNSGVFANDVASCVISNCSPADAAAAVGYFEALCSGATSSSVSRSGTPLTTTATGSGSVTSTASSTSGSSPSSSHSTNSAEQSTVSSTTSGVSESSTNSVTDSSTSASSATPTTSSVSHAVRGHTSMSFAGAGFALALAVALVAW